MSQILQQPLSMDKQTELMLKYGPKDTCWAANWGEKDEPLLQKYFIKSATLGREDNPMVIEFFNQMENKWNDHYGILEIDSKKFEIREIAKTKDIPTVQGLQYCCLQIIGFAGTTIWRYHGVGSDSREARSYQQKLYGETEPRADMTQPAQGSITRSSNSIRAVGIFPSSFPTLTVRESAVFNNVTAYIGVMLNRQVFANNPIGHTVNVGPFTVATDVNFAGETKWG